MLFPVENIHSTIRHRLKPNQAGHFALQIKIEIVRDDEALRNQKPDRFVKGQVAARKSRRRAAHYSMQQRLRDAAQRGNWAFYGTVMG
jgi:hypothetical protein